MRLRDLLQSENYAHRDAAIEQGWRPDALRRAMQTEGMRLVRRQWILADDAPEEIVAAASAGGRVSCVSAAGMLGLWRPGHDHTIHLRVSPHSGAPASEARLHRSIVPSPAHRWSLIDDPVNALAVVARCLPYEQALTVWDSAVATRQVSSAELRAVSWSGPTARRLAQEAGPQSQSGIETIGVTRLRRAGYRVRQQVRIAGHDVDALIGELLVVQFDGFAHHRAAERRRDLAHDRRLQLLGYTVLRFDYDDVVNNWPQVERQVRAAVAQGLHRRP